MNGQKKQLTLWIIRASGDQRTSAGQSRPDLITATYAYNQAGAAKNLSTWFARYPQHPYHSFTPQPNGFLIGLRTWLPGYISCSDILQSEQAISQEEQKQEERQEQWTN